MPSRTRFGRGRRRFVRASASTPAPTSAAAAASSASAATAATAGATRVTRPSRGLATGATAPRGGLSAPVLTAQPRVALDPDVRIFRPDDTRVDPDRLWGDFEGGSWDNPAFRLSREEDLLELYVQCFGLRARWSPGAQGTATLELTDPAVSATMALGFGSPHLAEDTALRTESGLDTPDQARLIGTGGRISLRWPAGMGPCGLDTSSLLARLQSLGMLVPPQGRASTEAPGSDRTALELPWRLYISPSSGGHTRLRAAVEPVSSNGWTELFSLRFVDRQGQPEIAWRAVGTPDLIAPDETHPGESTPLSGAPDLRASLTPQQRSELVHLTDNPTDHAALEGVRAPIQGEVALTLFGADATLRGAWGTETLPPPQAAAGVSLLSWDHAVRGGRDDRVKVVSAGVLFPFGFAAARVTHVDREVHGQSPVAWAVRRERLVVRQPVVELDAPGCPFVRFEVVADPDGLLDDPAQSAVPGLSSEAAWWARSGGADLRLTVRATDRAGRTVTLRTPVVFVAAGSADNNTVLGQVQASWAADPARHRQGLGGATVGYAGASDADAALPTATLELGGSGGAPIAPRLVRADVSLPALQALGADVPTVGLAYAPSWTDGSANPGRVWADLLTDVVAHPAARFAGGMAALQLNPSALALGLGPVAAGAALAQGDYAAAMRGLLGQTTLLGNLRLLDLLDAALSLGRVQAGDGALVPRLTFDAFTSSAHLHWEPILGDLDAGLVRYADRGGRPQSHLLCAELDATGDWRIETRITNFRLTFADALVLDFDTLGLVDGRDTAQDLQVELADVRFEGALSFVNELRELLSFGDGLAVDVRGTDLEAKLSFSVPSLPVGMFELSDLAISSKLLLPLDGTGPTVAFGISSRDRPFLVAVCGVGGGGWLDLELHTGGVAALEVGLFAGGGMSLDIGVASGCATIKIAVMFAYDGVAGTSTVTASIEVNGALTVLGLISISASFYLGLTYQQTSSGKAELRGTASLRVKVSVLFFSMSVTLRVERRLAGSDPPFSAQVSEKDWLSTWAAYAA